MKNDFGADLTKRDAIVLLQRYAENVKNETVALAIAEGFDTGDPNVMKSMPSHNMRLFLAVQDSEILERFLNDFLAEYHATDYIPGNTGAPARTDYPKGK